MVAFKFHSTSLLKRTVRVGGHQRAVVFKEALVKTTNSQKGTDIVGGSGGRPLANSLKLTLLRADAIGTDNKIGKF